MPDKDESEPSASVPVKVDLKAEASAKLNVNVDVPEESTGRLVDLITRRLEYWTAAKALKPGLLRLQQEQVALEVLEIAEKRMRAEEARNPLPNKFVAPFLEQASLEDPDAPDLKEIWAELLVSSSRHHKSEHLRFVSLLSEMTSLHCRVLERCALKSADRPQVSYDSQLDLSGRFNIVDARFLAGLIVRDKTEHPKPGMPDFEKEDPIAQLYSGGVLILRIYYHGGDGDQPEILESTSVDFWEFDGVSLAIEVLSSMGLLKQFSVHATAAENDIQLDVVSLTPLGVAFVKDCIPQVADRIKAERDADTDWDF